MNRYTYELRQKGYTLTSVAKRWGISLRSASRIAGSPTQQDWDALNGLPSCLTEAEFKRRLESHEEERAHLRMEARRLGYSNCMED